MLMFITSKGVRVLLMVTTWVKHMRHPYSPANPHTPRDHYACNQMLYLSLWRSIVVGGSATLELRMYCTCMVLISSNKCANVGHQGELTENTSQLACEI